MGEPVRNVGVARRFGPGRVFVALADRGDDFLRQWFGERGRRLARRCAGYNSERMQVKVIADAGGELHQMLCRR